ncbi:MAG: T9SS type A sorting domain-containing protein [Saprospiraceae bacterium]|nr:T9SS type A sorting domain-containing protein [Saprospiraceae bacterium]MDW8484902.1 hypothetical protein [Saprospiraceae bacterium]
MKSILVLALYFLTFFSWAQKHDYVWVYGHGKSENPFVRLGVIDFATGAPVFSHTEWEGAFVRFTCSMSDSAGRLVFYTNGCHVYDASGKIMRNGDTLNSPPTYYWQSVCSNPIVSSFLYNHGAFALPRPGSGTLYDLFHINSGMPPVEPPSIISFLHTVIDMNTPDGLGEVREKDVPLLKGGYYEPAAAVRHGNGRDWWIVIPTAKTSTPVLYRFLLTPAGVSGPWAQENAFELVDSLFYGGAQILIFTPDGSKMIHYHYYYGFIVYDFDRCTGLISNPRKVLPPFRYQYWQGPDVEVSSNSRYLYVILEDLRKIVQYDLLASDISSSADTVAVWDGFLNQGTPVVFVSMERGPDNKIYVCCNTSCIHVIERPDEKGVACNVRQRAIYPPPPTWLITSIPYFPNYRLYDLPNSPCDTLGIDTPVSVQSEPRERSEVLRVWPNPVGETFHVGWAVPAPAGARIVVCDALGRVALMQAVSEGAVETSVSTVGLPLGLYTLRVESASALIGVGRVSVAR